MDVKDIVKEAVIISESATLIEAVRKLISGQTNTLLVVDETGQLSGEVTVTDLLDAVVPEHLDGDSVAMHFKNEESFKEAVNDARDTLVEFFMSRDFSPVHMDDDLITVAATAIGHQRARIPVVDSSNRPIGVISRQGLKRIIANSLGIKEPS